MSKIESNKPKGQDEFKGFRELPNSDKAREFFKRHRVSRTFASYAIRLLFYTHLLIAEGGREILKDPMRRRFLFDREARIGFLEDSILNPHLYHPNREGASLEISSAVAGRYVGYDFHRPQEFGFKDRAHERQKVEGKLCLFALDEIKDNNASIRTPTRLLNIFDINHFLSLDFPSLEQAIEQGYLQETTYREAYTRVGLYGKYRLSLAHSEVVDKPVYAVTPKGNSVVVLMKDAGKKVEKPKTVPEFKPVFET